MGPVVAVLFARLSQVNGQSAEGTFDGAIVSPRRGFRVPLREDPCYSRLRQNDRFISLDRIGHYVASLAHYLYSGYEYQAMPE